MARIARSTGGALLGALCLGLFLARGAEAQVAAPARRPTPHEAIDRAMTPVSTALTELRATDEERAGVADLVARAETFAAEIVEADHHGARDVSQARARYITWVARAVRGRVEAMRVEASANEAERLALEAEARRTQARAALERLSERRAELDRGTSVATMNLPPPAPLPPPASTGDAGVARASDAAVGAR